MGTKAMTRTLAREGSQLGGWGTVECIIEFWEELTSCPRASEIPAIPN